MVHFAWQVELAPQDVWLDASDGDGAITRTLFPLGAEGAVATQATSDYTVTITTSDIKGAGTDASVFVTLFGTEGDSGRRALDTSKNNFERGSGKISLPQPLASLLITPQRVTTWRVYRGSALA